MKPNGVVQLVFAMAFLIFSGATLAQDGDISKASTGSSGGDGPLGGVIGDDCAGGIILDSGIYPDGTGNRVSPNVGIFTGLNNVRITKVCAAISQGLGDEASGDYDVVIVDSDGGGGEPGTELLRVGAANIAPVPVFPEVNWFATDVNYVHTMGDLYIGIDHFGSDGALSNTFLWHDDSAPNGGRFFDAAVPGWEPELDGIYAVRLQVQPLTEIEISISESDDPVVAGSGAGNLVYTVTATNNGGDATGLEVAVDLGLPGVGVTEDSTVPSQGSWSGSFPGTWSIGSLAGGGSAILTVTLTVSADAAAGMDVISVDAAVDAVNEEDTDDTNDAAMETTSIGREIDVAVTKTCPTDIVAGSSVNNYLCTIAIINNGPSQATNVVISDTFAAIAGVSDASLLLAPSLGSAGIVGGVLTWTIATLDANADSSLPVARTVSLQAAEGMPLISNTATVTATEDDTDPMNDSATADTNVRWPTATFEVIKEYTDGDGGSVNVTLDCMDAIGLLEYAPQSGPTTASLTVRRFDTDPAGSGTSCSIMEEVPAGYYAAERSDDCDVDPTADQGDYSCTITNAQTIANVRVTKDFTDGDHDTEVTVALDCNGSLIVDQDKTIIEGEENFVNFVLTSFIDGELNCNVVEIDAPIGYIASYDADIALQQDDDMIMATDDEDGCHFTGITGGAELTCEVTNDAAPQDVVITKEWIFEGSSGPSDVDTGYDLFLYCDGNVIEDGGTCLLKKDVVQGSNGDSLYSCKRFSGDAPAVFTASVIPEYPVTNCWVEETTNDSFVEVDNGCTDLEVSAATGGDSCTVTNLVFFEGIPTLSQYGIAVLVLLMLGVGMVGFRRYS